MTRARERLVVTAVAGADGGEDRPSRFLEELGVELPTTATPVARPFTGAGLVAELRHTAATSADAALVEAACRRLARMVDGDDDAPATWSADPDRWWGLAPLSDDAPLVGAGETVRVSPSKVESFDLCALRWFLQSGVGVAGSSGPPQVLGSVVHALCQLASGPAALTRDELEARLDEVLPELDLGAPWATRRRRKEALQWLDKFLAWQAANARTLVGTELDVLVELGPGAELRGRVDRLERDEQGRAVVVDLKTSTSAPRADELPRHAQLGAYQLAAERGAFDAHGTQGSGGASLLQLKKNVKATEQFQPALADDEEPGWASELVERVVAGMSGSTFPAQVNEHCERCPVRPCCPLWPEGEGVLR